MTTRRRRISTQAWVNSARTTGAVTNTRTIPGSRAGRRFASQALPAVSNAAGWTAALAPAIIAQHRAAQLHDREQDARQAELLCDVVNRHLFRERALLCALLQKRDLLLGLAHAFAKRCIRRERRVSVSNSRCSLPPLVVYVSDVIVHVQVSFCNVAHSVLTCEQETANPDKSQL